MTYNKPQQIVLASSNAGKIREIEAMLPNVNVLPQSQFVATDAEETGLTFVENAILKARHTAQHCKLPVLADDSGLAVDALNGAPGIYSARYAGVGASDQANLDKLLADMEGIPIEERTARFICVLVMLQHPADPVPLIAQGIWEGRILYEPKGSNGFGYDPIFYVPEHGCASAELSPEIKNAISHRGQALRKLTNLLIVERSFVSLKLDESLRDTLKEIFELLTKHKEFPYLLADDLLSNEIKTLAFLISNDLWGGAGSVADQAFVGSSGPRPQLEKLLIKLGRRQVSLGWVNSRTASWVEAFEKWQAMGLR